MFGKRRRVQLSATSAYLLEITRAILEDRLETKICLVQADVYSRSGEFDATDPVKAVRKYAKKQVFVNVDVVMAAPLFPLRHGREGEMPILPSASLSFVLTSEVAGWYHWYHWQILSAAVQIRNFYEPKPSSTFTLDFSGKAEGMPTAPDHLIVLATDLEKRRPTSFDLQIPGK